MTKGVQTGASTILELIDWAIGQGATDLDFELNRPVKMTRLDRIVRTDFIFSAQADSDFISEFDIPDARVKDSFGMETTDDRGTVRVGRGTKTSRHRLRITRHAASAPTSRMYAVRLLDPEPRSLQDCGVPDKFVEAVLSARGGLACVTGQTGAGKSTSLMALAVEFARRRAEKVVIVERPLEYILDDQQDGIQGSIVQIEVGTDIATWEEALELLMWIRPRLIIVGEVTSAAVMDQILALSDAGHTVLFTLHTHDAIDTISRILSFSSPAAQARVRSVVAKNLIATMGQRLVVNAHGDRHVMVADMFMNNPAAASVIGNPEAPLSSLFSSASVADPGMHIMLDTSLVNLVRKGDLTPEAALQLSDHAEELLKQFGRDGISVPERVAAQYRDPRQNNGW